MIRGYLDQLQKELVAIREIVNDLPISRTHELVESIHEAIDHSHRLIDRARVEIDYLKERVG